MSKQISFVHSETDVIKFISEVLERKCCFLEIKSHEAVINPVETVVDRMNTDSCKFLIIPYGGNVENAIEFDNCFRGNELSRTYEVGRLYASDGCSQITLDAFNELKKFIKRNYSYCKTNRTYFGRDFLDKHLKNYYFATNGMTQTVRFS